MSKEKESVIKSKFFLKLFGIPSICFSSLAFLGMFLPDEPGEEPLTWGDFFIGLLVILIFWFGVSFVISLIVNEIKKVMTKKVIADENKVEEKSTTEIVKEKSNIKQAKQYRNPKFIKTFMIILFIVTICSIWGAGMTWALANKINPQHGFNFTKTTWVFWCWLPIPLLSIILGFKYNSAGFKCTKNIVGGFIIGFLLFVYGAFCLFPGFSRDYSEIDAYRNIIDADLPDNGELEIQEWDTYFDQDKTGYVIINAYYDREDVTNLVNSIENNSNWILSTEITSDLKLLIPSQLRSDDDAYFSIYNMSTAQYNTLPEASGDYEIYAMKYDKSDKQLEIHKFNINLIFN